MKHHAVEARAAADEATADSAQSLANLRVADDELPDVNESLPLHKAAFFGNLEAIKSGTVDCSDVDARDRWGLTALHWAVIGEGMRSMGAAPACDVYRDGQRMNVDRQVSSTT